MALPFLHILLRILVSLKHIRLCGYVFPGVGYEGASDCSQALGMSHALGEACFLPLAYSLFQIPVTLERL